MWLDIKYYDQPAIDKTFSAKGIIDYRAKVLRVNKEFKKVIP